MRAIALIAWKDFRQVAFSPLFFLMTALSAIIWSITFKGFLGGFAEQMVSMSMNGREAPNIIRAVFMPHIQVTNLIFIVILPTLTMRLIAEEKKARTYDLLLTSPITATQIVLGKFLAGLGATSCFLLVSFLYPASIGWVANFSWTMLLTLYAGMFFMGALYTACGLFASALTESAMLAVFMGVIFNFLIWFIGPSGASSEIEWVAKVMGYLSVGDHMMSFVNGAVQVSAVVFFVSIIAFFLFLSQRVVESSRWR